MTSYRLDKGGLIDRESALRFTFDGALHVGRTGDTLASALLANGVTLMGRSFKYHRPRSVITAGAADVDAVTAGTTHTTGTTDTAIAGAARTSSTTTGLPTVTAGPTGTTGIPSPT